ncbi:hypothetical protein NW761_012786 [Fusarium oxysporum]|nr:hypothetical protein NW758_011907 [Fusarium oxysporum]KAJ4076132.1 hypothetical protein NW761_012786 [Fusarium oxysporum]WKT49723.1 hypothetical protein QSH57_014670 [Fusarium oxysporum f. sp. vasinfectum]
MEVLGAIVGCTSLALDIFNFATAELEGRGIDSLVLSLKHDVALLKDFARIFNAAAQSEQIPLTDKFLLNEICLALQPSLARIHSTIVRRKMSALTASPARKAVDKVHGFLYGKAEMQGISKDLFQWTERYHVRFGLLPVGLQTRLLAQGSDESLPGDIKALRETFRRLTDRSRSTVADGLRKSEGMVTLRPGRPSSRMFATMNQRTVIVEFKEHNLIPSVTYMNDFETDVAALAKLLSGTDPLLCRTLKGEGYFHQPSRSAFAFIYQVPKLVVIPDDVTRPTTLLDLIMATRPALSKPGQIELIPPKHALEQRFELARKITSAVMYVHVMQYVHKSIQTSNIVMFAKNDSSPANTEQFPKVLGEPFLCGFETSRYDRGASDGQGDVEWGYNIYRHPKRQGLHPQSRYTMNHDLYSLGVVLLELGLWRPLTAMGLRDPNSVNGSVKDHLKKLAISGLPIMMGTKYRDVVLFCLDIDGDGQISNSTAVEEVLKKVEELAIGMQ